MKKASQMTRDELIHFIHSSGCPMLKKLHLVGMTKEHIIEYLKRADCPKIKNIL
jgi:hypothetical protein